MLTRLRFKRDFRVILRCLSDKPSDGDGKKPEQQSNSVAKKEKQTDSSTDKIQALLKSMMSEPLSKEVEYRANFASAPDVRRQRKNDEIEVKEEKIEESITKAASDVAQAIGGDVKQTEAELLSKVLGKINQTSTSLSDLLIGMKVDHSKGGDERASVQRETRGEQVKRFVRAKEGQRQSTQQNRPEQDVKTVRPPTRERKSIPQPTTVNIFSGEPLNIFKAKEDNSGTKLPVWESLKQREVSLATSQQPANYFQKMILWTEQGKVWKFPINNEQGLEEEADVHFSEHIFLDAHLEGWCPPKGPIRHFMELVCVGLSKNPFYTAQEKKDHIMWYKEYFESKKDLLIDVGAWNVGKSKEVSA
ncbi:small ribosomal subunit protein mS31 [Cydia pomonella]|uniref:small ribosomal subunit protein mS31 n=1 Tax=Cydia pomonella TaxID=82600 RepID=UPI002ADD798C|nr:small ribosomal subunit protein mS31 [Cydia pomonella]